MKTIIKVATDPIHIGLCIQRTEFIPIGPFQIGIVIPALFEEKAGIM